MTTGETLVGIVRMIATGGGLPMGVCALLLVIFHIGERQDTASSTSSTSSTSSASSAAPGSRLGNLGAAICGVAVGVSVWLLWFSWGSPSGYETWAIVGAVVTAVVALVGISAVTRWTSTGPFVVALAGLFGFSSAFAVNAGSYDTTGLWGVGYLMIVLFAGFGLGLIATGVVLVRARKHGR